MDVLKKIKGMWNHDDYKEYNNPDPLYPIEEKPKAMFTEEDALNLFKAHELKDKISSCIKEMYPDIQLNVTGMGAERVHNYCYNSDEFKIRVTWKFTYMDHLHPAKMRRIIDDAVVTKHVEDVYSTLPINVYNYGFYLEYVRNYSANVLLKHAETYARCINKCIPLNINNINMLRINDTSIRRFAEAELELIDFIDPKTYQ